MYNIPCTNDLLKQAHMPFALSLSPFSQIAHDEVILSIVLFNCCVLLRVITVPVMQPGFLQVRENRKKSVNLSGQGKIRGNIFGNIRENEKLVPPGVRFSV